jgi:hypothetical protein
LQEAIIILLILIMLLPVLITALSKARSRSRSICCNCNLKQIGLTFRSWASEYSNNFPMGLSTNAGGTLEYLTAGDVFQHCIALSNELATPKTLVCPEGSRRPATTWGAQFANSNISYFFGLVSNENNLSLFLAGDRCITGGVRLANGILELTTNTAFGWDGRWHNAGGNVALTDASVLRYTTPTLRAAIADAGTNRIVLP